MVNGEWWITWTMDNLTKNYVFNLARRCELKSYDETEISLSSSIHAWTSNAKSKSMSSSLLHTFCIDFVRLYQVVVLNKQLMEKQTNSQYMLWLLACIDYHTGGWYTRWFFIKMFSHKPITCALNAPDIWLMLLLNKNARISFSSSTIQRLTHLGWKFNLGQISLTLNL